MPNPPLPTPEQLEAWSALCEQATPGPWEHVEWTNHGKEDHAGSIRSAGKPVDRGDFAPPTETWSWHIAKMEPDSPAPEANAAFIATARTALPSLLAAYRDRDDAIEMAWVIICNASGGNWDLQSEEWREAARKWGDANYGPLSTRRALCRPHPIRPSVVRGARD